MRTTFYKLPHMKLSGVHHCTIKVTDMERAVRFYRDILKLQEIEIPVTFAVGGTRVRWFEVGSGQIHLSPADAPDEPSTRHFALHVDDALEAREHLRSLGIECRETILIPGADRFFIHDPDGN